MGRQGKDMPTTRQPHGVSSAGESSQQTSIAGRSFKDKRGGLWMPGSSSAGAPGPALVLLQLPSEQQVPPVHETQPGNQCTIHVGQ
jgi:hypothetical protein